MTLRRVAGMEIKNVAACCEVVCGVGCCQAATVGKQYGVRSEVGNLLRPEGRGAVERTNLFVGLLRANRTIPMADLVVHYFDVAFSRPLAVLANPLTNATLYYHINLPFWPWVSTHPDYAYAVPTSAPCQALT